MMEGRRGVDVWERLGWLWSVLFYGTLVASSAVVLSETDQPVSNQLAIVGLAILLGLWHALFLWPGQDRLWGHTAMAVPLMLLAVVAWYGLVLIDPIFYFLLVGLFPLVYIYLPLGWAIATSLLLTALIILEQSRGQALALSNPFVWGPAAAMVAGVLLGAWINAIINQSIQRRDLIKQLEAAQDGLAAAQRREGVHAERERLAQEIHDTLAQGFTSIVMHLEAAEQALPDDITALQHHLGRARDTARDNLKQAREVVQDLRPDLLARQSLPAAIERVVDRWSHDSDIAASTAITGTAVPLDTDVDVALLRATQEALANVRQHARAGIVTVTLSYMGDVVVLDVQDDGAGMDNTTPTAPGSGFGLNAMRERVERMHGSLLIESKPGKGTTLVVEIPIAEVALPSEQRGFP